MNYLVGLSLVCGGDECGVCDDLYFEDGSWRLRYLVASDGGFIFKKRSLLAPEALSCTEFESCVKGIPLKVGRDQYDSAPGFESELPISRRVEARSLSHYNFPHYWLKDTEENSEGSGFPISPVAVVVRDEVPAKEKEMNLRSFTEVIGYDLTNSLTIMGKVVDMILDISDFSVAYLAVDSKPSQNGGVRLVSTMEEENHLRIDYANAQIRTDCSFYHLLESPSADLSEGRLSLGDQQKVKLSSY